MRKLKRERGAITIITIISILFMVSFLISSYLIISNKVKTQKNIIAQMRSIYDQTESMESMYNSFFGKKIVPIYTVEQLFEMGSGKRININGKYYTFSNTEDTIYTLMDDLSFNVTDYAEELNGYWLPIGERTEQNTDGFFANFEGNTHTITVGYNDDGEYKIEYSKANNFKEPEYEITLSPKHLAETGELATNASIYMSQEGGEFAEIGKGEQKIKVKRLVETKVYAQEDTYENSETKTILIKNPNNLTTTYNLVLNREGSFTIVPEPSDATVVIAANGVEIARGQGAQVVTVQENTNIDWTVSRTYYQPQTGSKTVTTAESLTVTLQENPTYEHAMLPTSIDTVGIIADTDNALDSSSSQNYAASGSTNASLTWNFAMPSWIDPNAKITYMKVDYKLSTSMLNHSARIILRGKNSQGTREFLSTSQDDISINILGKSYTTTYTPTDLITITDVSDGISLEVKKGSDSVDILRWHGANLTFSYVNP